MEYEIYILVELEKTYLLKKEVNLERISLNKDVSKILRGSLFLGHPLYHSNKNDTIKRPMFIWTIEEILDDCFSMFAT